MGRPSVLFCPKSYQPLYRPSKGCSGRQRGTARAKALAAPTTSSCSAGAFLPHYSGPLREGPLHEGYPGTSRGPQAPLLKGTSPGRPAGLPGSLQVVQGWDGPGGPSGIVRGPEGPLSLDETANPYPGWRCRRHVATPPPRAAGRSLRAGLVAGPAAFLPSDRCPVVLFLRKRNNVMITAGELSGPTRPAKLVETWSRQLSCGLAGGA